MEPTLSAWLYRSPTYMSNQDTPYSKTILNIGLPQTIYLYCSILDFDWSEE